jgi:membrane-bound ClpP family serine protease
MKTTVAGIGLLVVAVLIILANLNSPTFAVVAVLLGIAGLCTIIVGLFLWIVSSVQERKYRRGEVR